MQRTLITGASGFLGPWVVAAAVRRAQRDATLADPLGPPVLAQSRQDPLLIPRFFQPRDAAEWVAFDFASPAGSARDSIAEWLDGLAPSEVIHCAALSRAAACEQHPKAARQLNVDAPAAIAAWCRAHGARLVHVSSDLVFGEHDAPPGGFTEGDDPAPVSVYGQTKLDGERAIRDAFESAAIVRLPLLYGNSAGRGLGASDSLIDAVARGEAPGLFVDEYRTPLDARTAADALVELLDFEGGGVLHVAGPERITRFELGVLVLRAMGLSEAEARSELRPASQADIDVGAPRPRDVSLDASKAQDLLETDLLAPRKGLLRAIAP